MELRYPILAIFLVIAIICYFILVRGKENKYKTGSKIANTWYLKNTDYYKKKIKEYKLVRYLICILFGICGISAVILLARLSKSDTIDNSQYNRDIFLCMDVSTSVNSLNLSLVENLKETVKQLHGERFGVSIFNTSSVTLVPLTDDYDYVNEVLEKLEKSFKDVNDYSDGNYIYYYDDDTLSSIEYLIAGTNEGYETRGSSLIGDGLASCVYNFTNLEEDKDRTRIILFSTDNDLLGEPLVTLDKAAKISKEKKIKVFGIGTTSMKYNDELEFKQAVEQTGGKFYQNSRQSVSNIVEDIEKTSKSLLKKQVEKRTVDIPQIPFIILLAGITGVIIISKKVVK